MSTPGDNDWKWSNEQRDYYKYMWNTDGTRRVEWGRSRLPDPDSPPTSQLQPGLQQPQPQPHSSDTPYTQYSYSHPPHVPPSVRPAPVQSQHPPQLQYNPQPQYTPQHQYQPPAYQQVLQPQTPQQPASHRPSQDRGNIFAPTTPSNPSYSDSSPPSARSGGTEDSTYSPPNHDTYPQSNPWPSTRRPGQ